MTKNLKSIAAQVVAAHKADPLVAARGHSVEDAAEFHYPSILKSNGFPTDRETCEQLREAVEKALE
jgi:hypothetical protein